MKIALKFNFRKFSPTRIASLITRKVLFNSDRLVIHSMKLEDYFPLLEKCYAIYISDNPFNIYSKLDKRAIKMYVLSRHYGPQLLIDAAERKLAVCFELKPGYRHTGPSESGSNRGEWWEFFNNVYPGHVDFVKNP